MIRLKSDRLTVDIAEPGQKPNTTCRFERAGFVEEVTLDGEYRFCESEPHHLFHPCTGGRGLCNEFALDASSEAKTGEYFPKPGIGLFRKERDEPHRFFDFYKDVKEFPVAISARSDDSVTFTVEPIPCLGYALRHTKTVRVAGNALQFETTVQNVGERDFNAGEYCHNFLSVAGMALGPGYRLDIPSLKDMGDAAVDGALRGCGHGFTFTGHSLAACMANLTGADFDLGGGKPFEWTLSNSDAKARVSCVERIRFDRMTLWACDHMVSVESFHKLAVPPGGADTWRREWVFEKSE